MRIAITKYDNRHCHKWAQLLLERKRNLDTALKMLRTEDFDSATRLSAQIFYGVSSGKQADPGMTGSLLYHMAMVTKMSSETSMLLNELQVDLPDVSANLGRFYGDFEADAKELTKDIVKFDSWKTVISDKSNLSSEEKISLFSELTQKFKALENLLKRKNPAASTALENLFNEWAGQIIRMRLIQEYETIKGLLTLSELAKTIGLDNLQKTMNKIKDTFGKETVNIALDVTLKVGMRREKLQSIMLSDHFINYTMDIEKLDGHMEFLNCPIYGSHTYIMKDLGISDEVAALFCTNFCFAHAKAMLDTVLHFPFTLWHPKRMATNGVCEFYLKLAYSPAAASNSERFVPLVMSWNVTRECNLKCSHCYINAAEKKLENELTTQEGKRLIDQICQVSSPLLILSGGEPLLRPDIYELISYGSKKGLKMGLGSNGSLIDQEAAKKLKDAGIATISISLDSHIPEQHDDFRGVEGSWDKAVQAIKALRKNNVLVQVNTTLTQQNYNQIDDIMSFAEGTKTS